MSVYYPVFVGLGGYAAASYFFLKYPTLLHKKKTMEPVTFIAHRGGAGEGYENTMSTFRKCVKLGAEMIELDVQLTKDGEVVVSHDQCLLRTTGINENIKDTNFKDLPLIKQTISIDFDPSTQYSNPNATGDDRRIPKLKDVFEEFPNTQINIDVKTHDHELVNKVNELILSHQAARRCVWGNFRKNTTELCSQTNSHVGLLFDFWALGTLLLLFYTGLLPFVSLKQTHLEIPMMSIFLQEKFRRSGGKGTKLATIPPYVIKLVDFLMMSPVLFSHLSARGIHTYLWTLNEEQEFDRAMQLGATGIMTDYPDKLRRWLDSRNKL